MEIHIADSGGEAGRAAARKGARLIREALGRKERATLILATGASQFAMLETLVAEPDIDWHRVMVFHLDEYVGLGEDHPASFRKYLKERFVSKVAKLGEFVSVRGDSDPAGECRRLGGLIVEHPVDVAFVGIGENGHLAFNDPPADFAAEEPYLVVDLDRACRMQQVGEGWFASLERVPSRAISMSVRQILKSENIVVTVPDARKAKAVLCSVEGPVSPACPASCLQNHPRCFFYLDKESAKHLTKSKSA